MYIRYNDISGQKFGRLTALYKLHNTKGRTKWLCVCECGKLTEVSCDHLTSGHTKSCGCLRKNECKKVHTKHSKCHTRIYNIWVKIKSRCYNENDICFYNYGARGIAVCDEWKDDFQAFYDWSMANGYDDSLTIDRIDNNKCYEPNNCRWATQKQQQRNRRNNRHFTYNGETHCLSEWCEILGLKYKTVMARINDYKWTIKRALELER